MYFTSNDLLRFTISHSAEILPTINLIFVLILHVRHSQVISVNSTKSSHNYYYYGFKEK